MSAAVSSGCDKTISFGFFLTLRGVNQNGKSICCHGNNKFDDVKGAVSPIFEVTLNAKNICIDGIVKILIIQHRNWPRLKWIAT